MMFGQAPSSSGGYSVGSGVPMQPHHHFHHQYQTQYPGSQYAAVNQRQNSIDAVNHDMVAMKKRKELEMLIKEKEATLQSYKNNRVDVHDTAILERHIQAMRNQLQAIPHPVATRGNGSIGGGAAGFPSAAVSVASGSPTLHQAAAPVRGAIGSGPNGRVTKRDIVWQKKYQAYTDRVAASRQTSYAGSQAASTIGSELHSQGQARLTQQQQQQPQQPPLPVPTQQTPDMSRCSSSSSSMNMRRVSNPLLTQHVLQQQQQQQYPPKQQQQQHQPFSTPQQQQQQPQQHPPRHGRRSTPDAAHTPTSGVVASPAAPTPQSQASQASGFLSNLGNEPKQGYGRRRRQF